MVGPQMGNITPELRQALLTITGQAFGIFRLQVQPMHCCAVCGTMQRHCTVAGILQRGAVPHGESLLLVESYDLSGSLSAVRHIIVSSCSRCCVQPPYMMQRADCSECA